MVFLQLSRSIKGNENCSVYLSMAVVCHYNVVWLHGVFKNGKKKQPFFFFRGEF